MSKFVDHIERHKAVYIGAAVIISAGVIGYMLGNKSLSESIQKNSVEIKGVFYKSNPVVIHLVENSTPSQPLWDPTNKVAFNSKKEASRVLAVSHHVINKMLDDGLLEILSQK